jgi:hypothetical protein
VIAYGGGNVQRRAAVSDRSWRRLRRLLRRPVAAMTARRGRREDRTGRRDRVYAVHEARSRPPVLARMTVVALVEFPCRERVGFSRRDARPARAVNPLPSTHNETTLAQSHALPPPHHSPDKSLPPFSQQVQCLDEDPSDERE